ncbi:unnamed protein product, partial [Prorocentrum cordatum]
AQTPPELDQCMCIQHLFALLKKSERGSSAGRGSLPPEAAGDAQCAVGKTGGIDAAFNTTQTMVDAGGATGVLSVDISNGGAGALEQGAGSAQGRPLSALFSAVAIADPIAAAVAQCRREDLHVRVVAHADDLYVAWPAQSLGRARCVLEQHMATVGLQFNGDKTKVWVTDNAAAGLLPPDLHAWRAPELLMLGCTLYWRGRGVSLNVGFGASAFKFGAMTARVTNLGKQLYDFVGRGMSVQMAAAIFRYSAVGCPQHMLRAQLWPREVLQEGGLSVGFVSERAHAAFFAGWGLDLAARAQRSQVFAPPAVSGALLATQRDAQLAKVALEEKAPSLVNHALLLLNV